jgi:hypothetical protein
MPGIIEALISPQRHEVHKGFKIFLMLLFVRFVSLWL